MSSTNQGRRRGESASALTCRTGKSDKRPTRLSRLISRFGRPSSETPQISAPPVPPILRLPKEILAKVFRALPLEGDRLQYTTPSCSMLMGDNHKNFSMVNSTFRDVRDLVLRLSHDKQQQLPGHYVLHPGFRGSELLEIDHAGPSHICIDGRKDMEKIMKHHLESRDTKTALVFELIPASWPGRGVTITDCEMFLIQLREWTAHDSGTAEAVRAISLRSSKLACEYLGHKSFNLDRWILTDLAKNQTFPNMETHFVADPTYITNTNLRELSSLKKLSIYGQLHNIPTIVTDLSDDCSMNCRIFVSSDPNRVDGQIAPVSFLELPASGLSQLLHLLTPHKVFFNERGLGDTDDMVITIHLLDHMQPTHQEITGTFREMMPPTIADSANPAVHVMIGGKTIWQRDQSRLSALTKICLNRISTKVKKNS